MYLKGIASDSDNIFYDINQKILTKIGYFQISVDSNFTFTSYKRLCASAMLNRLKLCLVNKTLCKKCLSFHKEIISA